MDIQDTKAKALAMFREGSSVSEVVERLGVNKFLAEEWYDTLTTEEKSGVYGKALAKQTAVEIIEVYAKESQTNKAKLESVLHAAAIDIVNEMRQPWNQDTEVVSRLTKCCEGLARIQDAFFNKSEDPTPSVTINNLNQSASTETKGFNFREHLRD